MIHQDSAAQIIAGGLSGNGFVRPFDGETPLMRFSPQEAIARLIPTSVQEMLAPATQAWLGVVSQGGGITTTAFAQGNFRIIVQQDGYALKLEGYIKDVLLFKVELRDRVLDGMGEEGGRSPLNPFKVNHEIANGLPHPLFRAVELSVYSFQPDRYLPDGELKDFIIDPDRWMFPWKTFNPHSFFPLWSAAFASGNAPWQPAPPIRGFALDFITRAALLLKELGYHRLEVVCGWYNDVQFFLKNDYSFLNPAHAATFKLLQNAIAQLEDRVRTRLSECPSFNDRQRAWWVALQNVPEYYLSHKRSPWFAEFGHLFMGGWSWTNSPSYSDYCARMGLELNPFEWPGDHI